MPDAPFDLPETALSTSGAEGRPHVLVLCFSPLARDARVLRQIDALLPRYEVTTCGYGPAPRAGAAHVRLPDGLTAWKLDRPAVMLRRFARAYWRQESVRAAAEALRGRQFDLILADDVETVQLALSLRPRFGVHADLHEYSPLLKENLPQWRLFVAPYMDWICRTAVARADAVTTVAAGIAEEYERRFGFDCRVITNAAPFREGSPTAPASPLRLVHSGAAMPDRELEVMIDAVQLRLDAGQDLQFDLYLTPNTPDYVAALRRRCAGSGGRIRVLDPVPHAELAEVLAGYDVGLFACPTTTFSLRHALPNKFFDYIQARLAIVISPSVEMERLLAAHDLGVVSEAMDAGSFAAALALLTPERVLRHKRAADAAAPLLSVEHETPKLLESLRRIEERARTHSPARAPLGRAAALRARSRDLPPLRRWPAIAQGLLLRSLPLDVPLARGAARAARRAPGSLGARAAFALAHAPLAAGEGAPLEVAAAVRQILRAADAQLRRGRDGSAAELFDLALQLAFHPSLQSGAGAPPLASDPGAFLAPFERSTVGRLMIEKPDPERRPRETPADPARPRRILVLSHDSWTFVRRVQEGLESRTAEAGGRRAEWRTFDVTSLPPAQRPSHRAIAGMRMAFSRRGLLAPVPSALAEQLEWADVVLIEWGTYPLAWFSLLDTARFGIETIARLHRFEAFTPYPMLTAFSRIDRLRFVSPAVRAQVERMAPRLAQCADVDVIRNVHDLSAFAPAKDADSPFMIVQIGWAPPVKDALFALDVLARLRAQDPRYRLLLLGAELPAVPETRHRDWAAQVRAGLDQAGAGAEVLGFRDDVPQILARAGFVLSSSRHEGTHESVAEGAAAGCVPVVRDWPDASAWGGAATIYPAQWIVEDAEEAAQRILAHRDPEALEAAGAAAREWMRAARDPDEIAREYERLLGLRD